MTGHWRRVCEICGRPMEPGARRRLLAQREKSLGKFTECGWALYAHEECFEALLELVGRLKKDTGENDVWRIT